ncbi:MAG: hypothetical protein ACLFQX_03165 [Candidatus Kapaibacterium sp.]
MRNKNNWRRLLGVFIAIVVALIFLAPELVEARRGRSFGGSRSKRSFSTQKRTPSKSRTQKSVPTMRKSTNPAKRTSFGGNRLSTGKAYTQKYGTPRKTETVTGRNAAGQQQKYVMHSYGGYGSGLMTGYMMGTTSWMWMMPFHPAFYYSKPYYVTNPDGTMGVYPPTFSFGKLLFTLLIIGGIAFIIVRIVKSRKKAARSDAQSSFE